MPIFGIATRGISDVISAILRLRGTPKLSIVVREGAKTEVRCGVYYY